MSNPRSIGRAVVFDVDVSVISVSRPQEGRPPAREAVAPPEGVAGRPPPSPGRARAANARTRARRQILARATDEALLERSSLGDERAFQLLIERYRPSLLAYCASIAGHAGAQDALQQTFMSAWCALLRGCEVQFVRGWLFTIAKRAALQVRAEAGCAEELTPRLAGGVMPDEQFELDRRARSALAAVAGLPALERHALVETSIRGRSGSELASALGLSETAARQLIFRARARARSAFGALVPVALLGRLPSTISRTLRRTTALARDYALDASSLDVGGPLSRLAPVVVSGTLIALPLTATGLAHQRSAAAVAGHAAPAHRAEAQRRPGRRVSALRATGVPRTGRSGGATLGAKRESLRGVAPATGQGASLAPPASTPTEPLPGVLGRQVTAAPATAEQAVGAAPAARAPLLGTLASPRGRAGAGARSATSLVRAGGVPRAPGAAAALAAHPGSEELARAPLFGGAELGATAGAGHSAVALP